MTAPVLLFVLALASPAGEPPQTRATTGDVVVVAADADGSIVPGVSVTIASQDTGLERTGTTDARGRYVAPALAVGRYRVRAERSGYQPAVVETVAVSVGSVSEVRVVLRPGMAATIDVAATAPLIDLRRSAVAAAIGEAAIDALPIDRRDFVTFSLLAAGVSPDRAPSQGPVLSSGLVFAGQSPRVNNVTVDGVDNNDDMSGGVRAVFSQEAVREFQVLVSGYAAEFGQAAGGVINIVTRSGSNRPSGSAFEFFRDRALSSRGHFDAPGAPFRQDQFGGSGGGPLRRNRTFGFAAFERYLSRRSNAVTIAEDAASILRSSGFRVETGNVPFTVRATTFLGKVDYAIGGGSALTVRFNTSAGVDENSQPWGGLVARSRGGARDDTDHMLAVSWSSVGRGRIVSELRGQIAYRDQIVRTLDCDGVCTSPDQGGPRVEIPGVASLGRFNTLPQARKALRYQLLETVGYDRGSHRFKAGADVNLVDNRDGGLNFAFGGQFVFPTLQAFALGSPAVYVKGYGDGRATNTVWDLAAFAQDEWALTPRATLRAGVRLQKQGWPDGDYRTPGLDGTFRLPSPYRVAPRIGVAWDPRGDGRSAMTASYGVFHAHSLLVPAVAPHIVNGERVRGVVVVGPNAAAAWRSPGHQLPVSALGQLPSLTLAIDPDFVTAYTHQGTIGFNWQSHRGLALSASGVFIKGRGYPGTIDYNPTLPDLGFGRRPLDVNGVPGTSSSVAQYAGWGETWYRGLLLSLRQQHRNGSQWTAAYTLSKAEDTITDFLNSPPQYQGRGRNPADPRGLPVGFDPASERGPSLQDQRHRLVASGIYSLPYRFQLSGVATFASGRPFNLVAGADLNGDGDAAATPGPDRPRIVPGDPSTAIGRNAGRLPAESRFDLRVAKAFAMGKRASIQATLDVLNVFDVTTYTDINRVFGTGAYPSQPMPSFGQFTQAAPPRQVQLGLRFSF